VEPEVDPYALPLLPQAFEEGSAQVVRVPGWSDARHARAVERTVGAQGAELLVFAAKPGQVGVKGPAPYVPVVCRFLADRAAWREALVELDAHLLTVLPAELPRLGRLAPLPDGGAWAVLAPARGGDPLGWRAGRRVIAPRLTLKDGETGRVDDGERASVTRAQVRGGTEVGEAASAGVVPVGARLELTPTLAGEELLVLTLRMEVAAESAGPLALQLEDETDAHVLYLPRVRRVVGRGRFPLRRGETLWLVRPDPGTGRALVLQVAWGRATR
jgi:hypothetical protein